MNATTRPRSRRQLSMTLLLAAVLVTSASRAGQAVAQADDRQTGDQHGDGELTHNEQAIADAASDGPWMDGVSLERQQKARALFLEGNALIKEAFFADAAARYHDALALWDHPAFHFNLAMAQRALDQPIAAHESLGKAMRHGAAPLGQSKYEHAGRVRALLESQLGHIDVRCDEPGARVTLDGKLIFVGPGRHAALVRPGDHQIVASKSGQIPDTKDVVFEPGQKQQITLHLRFADRVVLARRWPVWLPYAVAGASTVFFAGGSYYDRKSSRTFSFYDDGFDQRCGDGCPGTQLTPELRDTLQRGRSQQNIARVIYAAGSAVLMGGVVLLYLNQERAVSVPGDRVPPARASREVWLLPQVSAGHVGLGASIRF